MNRKPYKIRVSRGDTTVEVSGDQDFVDERFDELCQRYLTDREEDSASTPETDQNLKQKKQIALGELYATADITYKRDAALLVGWYLEIIQSQEDFTKSEIEERALRAKVELGKNLSRDLSTLVEHGYLREVSRRDSEKTYYLTRTGESYVNDELDVNK